MKVRIATPSEIVVDDDNVVALRAEDESGSFGILPRHAEFLTSLSVSVVSWRLANGRERYCAVRRGILTMQGGDTVTIATREAVPGEDLANLEQIVLTGFMEARESERASRTQSIQLQMKAIRQIMRFLRPPRPGAERGQV